jgi:iron complex outermembrane receptor protein
MKKCYLLFFAVLMGIALAIGGIPSVYAQGGDSDEFVLEEITVTAQKRAESQQRVPIAMEVISGEEITELGKNDIDEMLQGVSNTIIEKAQDGYRVTIRGVTDNSEAFKGQSMAPPAVAINLDGVYSTKKDTGSGLFDVERVEVLYGPQSTLYSSNSPGGIVNVVTANPKLDKYEGSGSLEYGNYNLVHTEGALNAPLNDIMALRASFSTSKRDGYLSNGNDDEDTRSARLRTLIQPTDALSFVLTGETTRNTAVGFGGGVQAFDTEDGHWYEQSKAGIQVTYDDLGPVTDPWIGVSNDKVLSSDQITEKIYGQFTIDTNVGTVILTPSYSERNGTSESEFANPGSQDIEVSYMTQYVEEKSFEVRMSSPEDFPFQWIAGGTYYKSFDRNIDESQEYLDSSPTTVNGVYYEKWGRWSDRQMTNENKAFFLNVTYPVSDAFRATAGYRQSWDKFITDNYEIKGEPGSPDYVYAYEPFLMENDGDPDYKIGLEYDLADNSMLYASYATSYRVQGMGGGPPGTTTTQDPEELTAYTVGAKNRFFDNSLQLNAALYYYDYRNYRAGGNDTEVWLYDTDGDGEQDQNETGRDGNANGVGDGRVIGLDLSANWIISPNDRLNLTASYMNSEWTDLLIDYEYDYSGGYDSDGVWQDDLIGIGENGDGIDDFTGEEMMSSPPININLTYDHNFTLPNGGSLKAALTVKYKTAFDLSWRKADYVINHQEDYHMEDINLVYNDPSGNLSISAYCKNITNYAEKRSLLNMAGTRLLSIGNPRTYGAVLSVKF